MADEQSRAPFNKRSPIPKGFDWASLLAKDGDELEIHYRHLLETLGKEKVMLGSLPCWPTWKTLRKGAKYPK
jgi:type I restriction enzyme M protein